MQELWFNTKDERLKNGKNDFGSKLSNISSENKLTERVGYYRLAEPNLTGSKEDNFPGAANGMVFKGDAISGAASFSRLG